MWARPRPSPSAAFPSAEQTWPNYTVNTTATTTANITTRPSVVTATGANKVYDGTTSATATLSDDRLLVTP
jgi:hypothetical protein